MDQLGSPSSTNVPPDELDSRATGSSSDAALFENPAALDIQLQVHQISETTKPVADPVPTPVTPQSAFATQFEPPAVGLLLEQRLPDLVAMQLKQCEDPEYVAKADAAYAIILNELEAGLARIEAETGLKVVVLTHPERNPLTPPGLVRLFFPPSGLNPHLNWTDTSIATLYVLYRAGLTDLIDKGKVDFIDLHPCGAHASDPRSSTFPKLDKHGLTKQWAKFGCSNEVNALFETYNAKIELWRHQHTYGITLNLGKTSTVHFAERVHRVDPVPSFAAMRRIPVPPRYAAMCDCNPQPALYRMYASSSLDLASSASAPSASPSTSQQQPVIPMDLDAGEVAPPPVEADTAAARPEDTTYVVTQACHSSYGYYADPDSEDVRGDLVVHDALVSEMTVLLSGTASPPPIAKDYNGYTMRVFNMRQMIAHSTGWAVGLSRFTFPPWIRAAIKLLPVEKAAISAGTHPHGLLEDELPQGHVDRLVALAESWDSYGVESIGTSVKPTTLIERALAAFKCMLLEARRAQLWGIPAGTNDGSPVLELAATSDLRLAAQDGNVGAIAYAQSVGMRLRYGVSSRTNDDSPVLELAATSDLRFAAQDSNNAASAAGQAAREGHRWAVSAGVNPASAVNELAATSDLRFAAQDGVVGAAGPAKTALDEQRLGVPAGTNIKSPVLELASSSDLRFAAMAGRDGLADKGVQSRRNQRRGIDVEANPGTPVRELAFTSDLRAAAVAGTAGAGQAGSKAAAAQRHGTPARTNPDSPVHELASTSDFRLATLSGRAAAYDRFPGYVQPPKRGKNSK